MKSRIKQIFIHNVETNDTRTLDIGMDKTVKQLKKEIEKLFNLNYTLDEYCLIVVHPHHKAGIPIREEFENKTLFENHFKIGSLIKFGKVKNKGGGPGIDTIDVSKNQTKILQFNPSAPDYRNVASGLNIQAECLNERCEAYQKIVYCIIGFKNNYDILDNLNKGNIKCPVCENEVYPKNYGFLRCKYRIDFTKWENSKKVSNTVYGIAGNEFKIFDENSGNANFTKLIFTVTQN